MVRCPGCFEDFLHDGYPRHLERTSNPACIAVYQQLLALSSSSPSSPPNLDLETEDNNEDAAPIPFAGDYFGGPEDYDEVDFGWIEDEDNDQPDHVSDSESDDSDLEPGWEPPLVPMPGNDGEEEEEEEEPASSAGRQAIEEHLRQEIFIEHFPIPTAGALLHWGPQSEYHDYRDSLHSHGPNIWAPFILEIDWKIARWAKMRGPGSTAFSELLSIDGVSLISILIDFVHVLIIVLGSRSPWSLLQEYT